MIALSELTEPLNDQDVLETADSAAAGEEQAESKPQVARWYAVQVASSCEKKVKATLEQRAVTLGVSNRILEIEIPQTPAVKIKKDGSRQSTEEKVFPGYVLIRMVMDEDTEQAVRSTPNVINFVGHEERRTTGRVRGRIKPRPLSRSEVNRIFKRAQEKKPVVKVDLAEGDRISVHRWSLQGLLRRGHRDLRRSQQAQSLAIDLWPGNPGGARVLPDQQRQLISGPSRCGGRPFV